MSSDPSGGKESGASAEYKELKAGYKTSKEVESYKKQEVAKHKTKKDLWIIIHGKVYNVSEYSRDHPGGAEVFMDVAGKDATSAYEDVGHSEDAGEIMQNYLIGVLEGYEAKQESAAPMAKVTINKDGAKNSSVASGDGSFHLLPVLGGVAGLAGSVAALAYLAKESGLHLKLPSKLPGVPKAFHAGAGAAGGSFLQGVVAASAVLGLGGMIGAYVLQQSLTSHEGFESFAPYKKSVRPRREFVPAGCLRPKEYQQFRLRSREELSDGIYGFTFDLPTRDSVLGLPIGQHIAIRAEVNDHTVVRSYTPVSNNRDLGRLELIIRVYPDGQIGNYLKNLPIGSYVDIRGPKGAMKYRRYLAKNIGMVAGGTGITPMYQVIRAVCEDPKDDTHITLFYGSRTESDIMLKNKIDEWSKKYPEKLTVYYVLSHQEDWDGLKGFINKDILEKYAPEPGPDTRMFLCGPPPMIEAVKKTLVELGHEAPGAVGKMTDKVFCF